MRFVLAIVAALTVTSIQASNIYQACVLDGDCPTSSSCRQRACDGHICLCNAGYLPNGDMTKCLLGLQNIAVGKPTNQSSQAGTCKDNEAVDGDTGTVQFLNGDCKCAMTFEQGTQNPWWSVNLGDKTTIQRMCVVNRDGAKVLHDFQVWLYDSFNPAEAPENQTQHSTCYTHKGQVDVNATVCFVCSDGNNTGRDVVIRIPGPSEVLALCEVQVFASNLAGTCNGINTGCLSIDSTCSAGKCACKDGYEPNSNNKRCKLEGVGSTTYATLGEPCNANIQCQNSFEQKCDASTGKCVCDSSKDMRTATTEELQAAPLKNAECRLTGYSLENMPSNLCPGRINREKYECSQFTAFSSRSDVQTPALLFNNIADVATCQQYCENVTAIFCVAAIYNTIGSQCGLYSYGYTEKTAGGVATEMHLTRNCTLRDQMIYDNCTTDVDCPDKASCRLRHCDGKICVCNSGYINTADRKGCVTKGEIGGSCGSTTGCPSPFSECVSGRCVCQDGYEMADKLRCRPKPKPSVKYALLKEACTTGTECFPNSMTCSSLTCQCASGYREATADEKNMEPLNINECRRTGFDINVCAVTTQAATTTEATTAATQTTTSTNFTTNNSDDSFQTIMTIVGVILGLLLLVLMGILIYWCYSQKKLCFSDPYDYAKRGRNPYPFNQAGPASSYNRAVTGMQF